MTASRRLCLVLQSHGRRAIAGGAVVDFDAVYRLLVHPAIEGAGLQPVPAMARDGLVATGAMLEQLLLSEHAIVDLGNADAGVFHAIGARHATRPQRTVAICAATDAVRGPASQCFPVLHYQVDAHGIPARAALDAAALTARLRATGPPEVDRPLYQLLQDFPGIAHEKTDIFRDSVHYPQDIKLRLRRARAAGHGARVALGIIESTFEPIQEAAAAPLVDLMLSYRAVSAWHEAIDLIGRMPLPLRNSELVQEQLGFALNRAGRGEEAERVLLELIALRGGSSETFSILGRVYKDRWQAALSRNDATRAESLLRNAAETYLRGFEADWRDALPGINTVTLMELMEPPDPRRLVLLPLVKYAVHRRIATGAPDYWDHAALLELSVLAGAESEARDALTLAIAAIREKWEPESTANNLRMIGAAQVRRGAALAWFPVMLQQLEMAARSSETAQESS